MSFTNQKPFVLTEELNSGFKRRKSQMLCCALCGHEFEVGETLRWVYGNSTEGFHGGNFFVCEKDDTEDLLLRAKESFDLAKKLAKQWGVYGPDWQ